MWLWCERRSSTACFTAMLAPCPSMTGLCPGHTGMSNAEMMVGQRGHGCASSHRSARHSISLSLAMPLYSPSIGRVVYLSQEPLPVYHGSVCRSARYPSIEHGLCASQRPTSPDHSSTNIGVMYGQEIGAAHVNVNMPSTATMSGHVGLRMGQRRHGHG